MYRRGKGIRGVWSNPGRQKPNLPVHTPPNLILSPCVYTMSHNILKLLKHYHLSRHQSN